MGRSTKSKMENGEMKSEGAAKNKIVSNDSSSELSIEERIELLKQARRYAQHAKGASFLVSPNPLPESPSTALEPNLIRPCTSYVLSRDEHLESNVDCWLESSDDNCVNTEILRRNATIVLQSTRLAESPGTLASLWYMLALLPLVNYPRQGWCSPRNSFLMVLNSVEFIKGWLKQLISYILNQISRLDIDRVLQNCFVVGLDIALALHGLVFLMLTFYQSFI